MPDVGIALFCFITTPLLPKNKKEFVDSSRGRDYKSIPYTQSFTYNFLRFTPYYI